MNPSRYAAPDTSQAGSLQVNGILYVSVPDNAWAVDARDGTILWHYFWKTKGGTHIGNRGMGMYKDWLYFETPDDYLVSLDAKTGKERWHKVISDFNEQYFSTIAPIVIGNHLLVGTADDLDAPGFLQSFDPETGELQWKWYSEPEKMGDPGSETWPNLDSMRHGGAGTWVPGSYDPDLHLYYFGTANPTPAFSGATREGDNLYTSCIVALNVDTGKLAWAYQPSPHDTHDWDAAQTPIIVDGTFAGKPRKLLLDASRNGYFFVLDRVTGEHLLTVPYADTLNWATGLDKTGRPMGNPRQGRVSWRCSGLARLRRNRQLAAADLRSANRTLLRCYGRGLFRVLPHGTERPRPAGSEWGSGIAGGNQGQIHRCHRL